MNRQHFNVPKLTKYYQFKLETESTETKKLLCRMKQKVLKYFPCIQQRFNQSIRVLSRVHATQFKSNFETKKVFNVPDFVLMQYKMIQRVWRMKKSYKIYFLKCRSKSLKVL